MARHSSNRGRLLDLVERVLWITGSILVLVVAWVEIESHAYQAGLHPQSIGREFVAEAARFTSAEDAPGYEVAEGEAIGRLEIPRLDLSVLVAEGASDPVLRRAVGRVPGSATPGVEGNLALAGHRDSFFRPLENVERGDLLVFDSRAGRSTYRVDWIRIVEPEDTWVLDPTPGDALTLITCYPFRYVGSAPQRYVVRAHRVDGELLAERPEDGTSTTRPG